MIEHESNSKLFLLKVGYTICKIFKDVHFTTKCNIIFYLHDFFGCLRFNFKSFLKQKQWRTNLH